MKYALLLDGGFVYKVLRRSYKRNPTAFEVYTYAHNITLQFQKDGHTLLRIYYYDSPPSEACLTNPISRAQVRLGNSPVAASMTLFHQELQMLPDIALRLGEIRDNGWRLKKTSFKRLTKSSSPIGAADIEPNLQQKGVDLRIGLDIARLALRQLVETIVVVSGDSDLIPAYKFARREGLRVFLVDMGHGVYPQVIHHVDRQLAVPIPPLPLPVAGTP